MLALFLIMSDRPHIAARLSLDRRVDLGVTYAKYAHRSLALAKTKSTPLSAVATNLHYLK